MLKITGSRRAAAIAVAMLFVPIVLTMAVAPATSAHGDPTYCDRNPGDPRCDPEYCHFNPDDPWCWDPNYCLRNPSDPICRKEPQQPKAICSWSMTAAPPVAGSNPGPALVRLECPNHILANWECGAKDMRSPLPIDPTPSVTLCTYNGEQAEPNVKPCGKSWSWSVARPDVRTVTAWVRADLWKDADCDGAPDDWNTNLGNGQCKIPNWYSPKMPPPPFGYSPTPDGKIDECDQQHYEWQWRQFN